MSTTTADATEVVGTALLAKSRGHGHRRVARELGRPVSTVRRRLRRVRRPHVEWLRRTAVEHLAQYDLDALAGRSTARNS